jgi:hypothetical protein
MKNSIDNGQITFNFGTNEEELRIQLYWPHFQWKNVKKTEHTWTRPRKEFFFSAATNLRVVLEEGYWGFGANVLGFGGAADYQKTDKKDLTRV